MFLAVTLKRISLFRARPAMLTSVDLTWIKHWNIIVTCSCSHYSITWTDIKAISWNKTYYAPK